MGAQFFPARERVFGLRWIHLHVTGKPGSKLAFTPVRIIRTGISVSKVKNSGG